MTRLPLISSLRELLVEHFDAEELRLLAFDLGIDPDNVSGSGKEAKAQSLLEHLAHRGQLSELLDRVRYLRPNVNWPNPNDGPTPADESHSKPRVAKRFSLPRIVIVLLVAVIVTVVGGIILYELTSPGSTSTPTSTPQSEPTPPLVTLTVAPPTVSQTPPPSVAECNVTVSSISASSKVVRVGETVQLSISVNNPDGRVLQFNWGTLFGKTNPGVGAIATKTTYTAPEVPTKDTVTLTVDVSDCGSTPLKRTVQLLVID